jgi:hypothetical protein
MLLAGHENFIFKKDSNALDFLACERMLGRLIRPFISELCTIDPGLMISYICTERNGNIGDIVDSSTEVLRRPEWLRYGQIATVDFDWGEDPAVTLQMEFLHDTLTAFFNLVLEGRFVGVDILAIFYKEAVRDAAEKLRRFSEAMAELEARWD